MTSPDDVTAIFDDRARCHRYDQCHNYADGYIDDPFDLDDPYAAAWACRDCAHTAGKTLHQWEE